MEVTLVITVKNEAKSMERLLGDIFGMTRVPDETVIVDGGSTDGTREIVRKQIESGRAIRLVEARGANIARGRNLGIREARHEVIAVTDGGCRLRADWLAKLLKPMEADSEVEVVSGWYEYTAETAFEKKLLRTTKQPSVAAAKAGDFLPSSRSVAFRKSAWQKAGGYPEWLSFAAEDTQFDLQLQKAGCKFGLATDAVVEWRVRGSRRAVFKQHYLYGVGSGESRRVDEARVAELLQAIGFPVLLVAGFFWVWSWVILVVLLATRYLRTAMRVGSGDPMLQVIWLVTTLGSTAGFLRGLFRFRKASGQNDEGVRERH